ncbi:MAG: hypothetical protein ACWGQW_01385 [bacterium]
MSKITDVNEVVATGAAAIFKLKTVLKAAGWTVPRSSDGLTYNSTGDQITHAGTGAGGMENNRAWFVIQSPNGEHQWCFQKESGDNAEWRVKVSPLAGFVGGSPSAIIVPTATDQTTIFGSGTDASPTFVDMFPVDGTYRFNAIAENAPVGTTVPIYPFWAFAVETGNGAIRTFIMQEALEPGTFKELTGTRAVPVSGEPDPCIYACSYHVTSGNNAAVTEIAGGAGQWADASPYTGMYFRLNYGSGETGYRSNQACRYLGSTTYARQVGPYDSGKGFPSNPYNGADDTLPIYTGRPSGMTTAIGFKGACNRLKMKTMSRTFPDSINLSTDAYVYAGDLVVPWEDGTVPIA